MVHPDRGSGYSVRDTMPQMSARFAARQAGPAANSILDAPEIVSNAG
jgi:hypothetical protein